MAATAKNAPGVKEIIAKNKQLAMELRIAGANQRQIAERLNVSQQTVSKYLKAAMAELARQTMYDAEQNRAVELQRLDMAILAIAPQVKRGHLGAIDRWIRLSERRSKLLGLDAPARTELDSNVPVTINFGRVPGRGEGAESA